MFLHVIVETADNRYEHNVLLTMIYCVLRYQNKKGRYCWKVCHCFRREIRFYNNVLIKLLIGAKFFSRKVYYIHKKQHITVKPIIYSHSFVQNIFWIFPDTDPSRIFRNSFFYRLFRTVLSFIGWASGSQSVHYGALERLGICTGVPRNYFEYLYWSKNWEFMPVPDLANAIQNVKNISFSFAEYANHEKVWNHHIICTEILNI